jgi:uncharacterized protein involved in tolerance to divalent cations
MNDTETEARRLLNAATEDRPPGIDLLDGFAKARRRDRTRRTRARIVLSAGAAAAAATVSAVALTIGSAPPALATVTSALTRTLAQSYHVTQTDSSYYIWNGRIKYPSHLTCTTEADPVRHLSATSCSNGPVDREVGGYTYLYIPYPVDHPGKHWERTPTRAIGNLPSINSFIAATPQQMLSRIKQADKVTVAGSASGPGWTGTRYAFSSGSPGVGDKISGTVDVDRQGRARALALTVRSTSAINVFVTTQVLTFSDFGARVTVTPPPADQTFRQP